MEKIMLQGSNKDGAYKFKINLEVHFKNKITPENFYPEIEVPDFKQELDKSFEQGRFSFLNDDGLKVIILWHHVLLIKYSTIAVVETKEREAKEKEEEKELSAEMAPTVVDMTPLEVEKPKQKKKKKS